MKKQAIFLLIAVMTNAAMGDIFGTGVDQFTIDFVSISGDASSANGTNISTGTPSNRWYKTFTDPGSYRIGSHEITNDQWNNFEASYGVIAGNPSTAYDMDASWTGDDVPVNNISWYAAAQFINYLNISSGHQEAYKFTGTRGTNDYTFAVWELGDAGYDPDNPFRNSNTHYFLPTEDEWVKAAYWNGSQLQTYATKSGGAPFQGDGSNGGCNYYSDGYSTDPYGPWQAGSGSEELNGTFDMMGNIWEFMESPYIVDDYISDAMRHMRGSSYEYFGDTDRHLTLLNRTYDGPGDHESDIVGFRVAAVPEPCTAVILVLGFGFIRKRRVYI